MEQPNIQTLTQQLNQQLEGNPLVWGKVFCAHHFRMPSPNFHIKIVQEAINNRYFAVASPRESSKSTLLAFLVPLHSICFKHDRFIVMVSNTYKKAASSLDTIKKEILENEKLKAVYPITITRDAEGDSIFRHPDGFETQFLCKGAEQIGSIRGVKFGAWRPTLIIGDDIEDDELVRNPDRRRELQEVFDEALIPAGDKQNCKYIFIGTILHDDSQMARLVSKEFYPEYRKLMFRALIRDDKGELVSLWKDKWTVEELKKLKADKPSVFAKEYQNDPVSGAMRKFDPKDFRYWKRQENTVVLLGENNEPVARYNFEELKASVACDLAWETKRESDFSVILPAFLTPNSEILLDDYICKKGMRPHEIEETLFELETRLKSLTGSSVYFGFEKAKLEKVIRFLLGQAMRKRNHWLIFKDLVWDADKVQRVVTRLEPRYATHSIYHKRGMGELERQLTRFPSGTHDDLPDALQGVIQLLQFPKGKKSVDPEDDAFMKVRQMTIDSKKPDKNKFIFGNKGKWSEIPFKKSLF